LLLRVVDLFTFCHGINKNQQSGRVTLMWPAALSSAVSVFDVATRYLEEILLDLIETKKKKRSRRSLQSIL